MAELYIDDPSERKLLGHFVKKQAKYGSTSVYSMNKDKYIKHLVQTTDTLAGLSLRYGISIEKIKRANNLWTTDSLFLRTTLNIPVPCDVEMDGPSFSHKSRTSSNENADCIETGGRMNGVTPGKSTKSKVLMSSKLENGVESQNDESAADFLIRIDSYIAKSKDSIMQQKSKLTSTYSDDDLFKLRDKFNGGYQNAYGSGRSNSLSTTSLTDYLQEVPKPMVMTQSRKVKSSLKRLEREQDELFEL